MRQIFCEDDVIKICGVINFANVMQIYKEFCNSIDSAGKNSIEVNLAAVECVDSSILPCLVLAVNHAKKNKMQLQYISSPAKLTHLASLCGLEYLLSPGSN